MTFLGIKEIIFMSDKYHDTTEMTAARRMFDLAGIVYRQESFQLTLFLFWKGRKWCVTETNFRAIVFFFAFVCMRKWSTWTIPGLFFRDCQWNCGCDGSFVTLCSESSLTLLWTGGFVRWPPQFPYNMNYPTNRTEMTNLFSMDYLIFIESLVSSHCSQFRQVSNQPNIYNYWCL